MPREKRPRRTPRTRSQKSIESYPGFSAPQPSTAGPTNEPYERRRDKAHKSKGNPSKVQKHTLSRSSPAQEEDGSSYSSDVGAIPFESNTIEISEDEDDEKSSSKRPKTTQRRLRLRRAGSEEVGDMNDLNEETVGVPVTWKGKGRAGKRKQATISSSSDEDPQPRRKKFTKGVRPSTPEASDLRDEVDEHRIIDDRLRNRSKTSIFQRNLERLKRKKRGESLSSESSSSSEEAEIFTPFTHAKPSHSSPEGSLDDNEDTFIVEDGNDAPELPAEFSMSAHQDLKHHFKIVCQLFVHVAVQEVENRKACMKQLMKDQYFSIPLSATRRKIIGMRDSLVTSSVWRTEFKKPLEKYPEIEIIHLDYVDPSCDACHLGGRLSTRIARVKGAPYDPLTFQETIEDDASSDLDSEGEEREPQKKEFHLGRFCAARTHAFHSFTHWEHTLFRSLEREIDGLRNNSARGRGPTGRFFVPVAYAGGIPPPDDLTDADGMMAWLDSRKVIDMEWQRIREMMDKARSLDISAKRGDDDDAI